MRRRAEFVTFLLKKNCFFSPQLVNPCLDKFLQDPTSLHDEWCKPDSYRPTTLSCSGAVTTSET